MCAKGRVHFLSDQNLQLINNCTGTGSYGTDYRLNYPLLLSSYSTVVWFGVIIELQRFSHFQFVCPLLQYVYAVVYEKLLICVFYLFLIKLFIT